MSLIYVLDEATINQIAAGEVVERPSAVVKELIENAMDAGATAITAEIKEGGLSFIRITDNGGGIAKEDIPLAFMRHATSKIQTAEDLLRVRSLGFRGEALSSIASVAQVELITKTPSALNGFRYTIEGGEEKSMEEIGCPGGTTIIVRNLFYNTPARRKFLKSPMTEASYISDLMERLMVSHPNISFKFIMNNQVKLQSTGNNNSKDILYQVYGRDIVKELLPLEAVSGSMKLTGYLGKPVINRGNRNYENYFINGRYIKSNVITRAIEEAYKPYMMQHKYPFTSIYFELDPALIDVNVHPQKLEVRLGNGDEVYQFIYRSIRDTLAGKELIPRVSLSKPEETKEEQQALPEPFEQKRRSQLQQQSFSYSEGAGQVENKAYDSTDKAYRSDKADGFSGKGQDSADTVREAASLYPTTSNKSATERTFPNKAATNKAVSPEASLKALQILSGSEASPDNLKDIGQRPQAQIVVEKQMNLFADSPANARTSEEASKAASADTPEAGAVKACFLSKEALSEHRIIGQLFSTYWLVEYKKELYIIDQHAAHEKVLYERIMAAAASKTNLSQQLFPPIVLSLTLREQEILQKRQEVLESIGYEIEPFGGNEFSVRAVPADLYGLSEKELLQEFIDDMVEDAYSGISSSNSILERVATMSCKAAVKANHSFSYEEAAALIKELLTLENPYHCPHGRPVIISMSQYELERKFKRIL